MAGGGGRMEGGLYFRLHRGCLRGGKGAHVQGQPWGGVRERDGLGGGRANQTKDS